MPGIFPTIVDMAGLTPVMKAKSLAEPQKFLAPGVRSEANKILSVADGKKIVLLDD